jgi:putative ATPase
MVKNINTPMILQLADQEFLPDAVKTAFYVPGNNSRENTTREFLKNRWKGKYGY